jgi:hypothetical protein
MERGKRITGRYNLLAILREKTATPIGILKPCAEALRVADCSFK